MRLPSLRGKRRTNKMFFLSALLAPPSAYADAHDSDENLVPPAQYSGDVASISL